jgi:regulator of protease activity HflC (stomatin/prohibitin superfamily)
MPDFMFRFREFIVYFGLKDRTDFLVFRCKFADISAYFLVHVAVIVVLFYMMDSLKLSLNFKFVFMETIYTLLLHLHLLKNKSHMEFPLIALGLVVVIMLSGLLTVSQGSIAVITMFGKYRRILHPGLRLKIPFVEKVFKRISIQNQSIEMEFQAVTVDQANVYFKSMLLYSVMDEQEETIKKVAFKFISNKDFMQALIRTIEGSIRSYVASQKQSEILGLRHELVDNVKEQIDHTLESWGFHLLDLQINDITFDAAIIESMSKVVASNNLKAAAENEGQALLITKTKAAEAEGNAIKIAALAEKEAAMLRGQGVALFRQEVAKGMSEAAEEMKQANLDTNVILFSMWTEAIKNFAEYGKGNTIFLDGSPAGMDNTMRQIQSMLSGEIQDKKK